MSQSAQTNALLHHFVTIERSSWELFKNNTNRI